MKGLLIVAGLASGLALVTGGLLLAATPRADPPAEPSAPARPVRALPGEVGPDPVALEARIRALEARIAELQASGAGRPAAPEVPVREPSPKAKARDGEIAWDMTLEEFVKVYGGRLPTEEDWEQSVNKPPKADAGEPKPERRWEKEIRRRVDRFAEALALSEFEKARAEEIVRGHLEKSLAIAARARESLKGSPLGYTAAERAQLTLFQQERDRLNKETEQSFSLLVGPERLSQFLKAEKAQAEKEAAVRRMEKPW
jgi:hypothetical protein